MRRRTVPFVGRETELARLMGALAQARTGRATFVAIGGIAGVGKSRLAGRLAELACDDGADVHAAVCPPAISGTPVPYAPFTGIARSIVHRLDARRIDELLGSARSGLASLLPELGGPSESAVPPAEVAEALLLLLGRMARAKPMMILLDDLHRAGPTALDILVWLVHELREAKILVVATHQTDRAEPVLLEMLADLERLEHVERIELGPLTPDASRALLREVAGILPGELETAILKRAEGLPFYLEELGAAGKADVVPESVRVTVRRRLERIGDRAARLVRAVAVAGGPVDVRLLGAAAREADVPFPAIGAALDEGLLVASTPDDQEVAIPHPLTSDAIIANLRPGEKREIALRLCGALDARLDAGPRDPVDRSLLRARLLVATADREAAMQAFATAANIALQANAFPEADLAYTALEDLDRDHASGSTLIDAELLERAARAAWLARRPARAVALGERAIAVAPSGDEQARAEVRLARYEAAAGATDTAIRRLRSVVDGAGSGPIRWRAALDLGRLLLGTGEVDAAAMILRRALIEARRSGDRRTAIALGNGLAVALASSGRHRDALAVFREGDSDGSAAADPSTRDRLTRLPDAVIDLLERVRLSEDEHDHLGALETARRAGALADRLGLSSVLSEPASALAALQLVRLGRWEDALTMLHGAPGDGPSAVVEALLDVRRGDMDAARAALASSSGAALAASPGGAWMALRCLAAAEGARIEAQLTEARRSVTAGLTRAGATAVAVELCILGVAIEADARTLVRGRRRPRDNEGHADPTPELIARGRALLASTADADAAAKAAWAMAMSDRLEAEQTRIVGPDPLAWERAVDSADAGLGPFERASARAEWAAAALAVGGDRGAIRVRLMEAMALTAALGARPLGDRVRQLAASARLRLDDAAAHAPGTPAARQAALASGLSDREVDVLALLADGASDREIATRLFISERTANHHVSHILTKLGLGRRGEAAALAHRLGLTSDHVTQ